MLVPLRQLTYGINRGFGCGEGAVELRLRVVMVADCNKTPLLLSFILLKMGVIHSKVDDETL